MSNAIKCKKYREKQKLLNLHHYKEKEKQRNKLKYKKFKNEPIEEVIKEDEELEELIDETVSITDDDINDNEINDKKPKFLADLNIVKVDDSGFIIYKPIKKRLNILNKSQLQPQTIKLYFN